jgi:NAD(P)-dependent dehydrogenase (short-subunit alcohol dehydrogenase family)
MNLSDVRAVITGGASGLGLAVAEYLIANGGRVTLLDVDADKALAAMARLGSGVAFQATDVSSESAVVESMAAAAEAMGGLNAAISCAGILGAGRALGRDGAMPLSKFETTVRVNLIGSFNVAKAAAEIMQGNTANDDGERGVIINTASIAAFEGQIGQAAYSASKGGVVAMTLPLAREFARIGIRVVTIAPGVFHTPMVDGMPADVHDALCAQVPFPSRLGKPSEFADSVGFVLQNAYINGETLRIDGAIRLPPK